MVESVIEVNNLEKSYGSLKAVAGISFDVKPGEVFSLLGPNGAGKTTTIEILEGLRERDEGDVKVLGLDPWKRGYELHRKLGVIPQGFRFFDYTTPKEAVQYYASLFDVRVDADAILKRVLLGDVSDKWYSHLSGGQKQKYGLALALVNDPQLVFLDEPTTGLDPQARHLLWDRLYRLKQRGVTLVLTTHYMDEAEQLCDRLVVMDKAKIVAELRFAPGIAEGLDGRLDGIAQRVEHLPDRVLLYADDGEAAASAVHQRGLKPETVLVRRSSLEDVFLRLTGRSLIE